MRRERQLKFKRSMVSFTLQAVITTREELPIWLIFITTLGFLTILQKSIQALKWIFVAFVRPSKNLKATYGSWALVTGATDGIGRAFAFQLASKGLNVILVGRNPGKLKTVSDQIMANSPESEVKTVVVDFSGDDVAKGVEAIEAAIEGLEVGVLINNVGVTYPKAMYFHEVEESIWMNIVRVNLEGTTRVTRAVITAMIARKKGAIVCIGSGAAIVVPSHPLFTVYAATKAYVDQLSRCLSMEYKSCRIDVQCQVPLYVATKMVSKVASIEKSSLFVPSADEYARAGICSIGFEHQCTPYWTHSLQWFFASLLSDNTLDQWRLAIGLRRRSEHN